MPNQIYSVAGLFGKSRPDEDIPLETLQWGSSQISTATLVHCLEAGLFLCRAPEQLRK